MHATRTEDEEMAQHWEKRNMAKEKQKEGKKKRRTCGLVNSCSNAHRGELQ